MTGLSLRTVARAVGATLLFVLLLLAIGPRPIGGHIGVAIVRGTSMQPTYHTGDLVVTVRRAGYATGDVLLYDTDQGRVIHRIVGQDGAAYVTQGDNRAVADDWRPTDADVVGRPALLVPAVGGVVLAVQQALGANGLIALSMLAVLVAARPTRERHARPWGAGTREAAVAASAAVVLGGALAALGLRTPVDAWAAPVPAATVVRLGIATALFGGATLLAAVLLGRGAHVRARTLALDLALGTRVVDVDDVDLADVLRAPVTNALGLRRAADRDRLPVLRTPPDVRGRRSYIVLTDSAALVLDSGPATAGPAHQPVVRPS